MNESQVDINIYLLFMKSLIEKYGNFKISQDLHNDIIYHLGRICELVEFQIRKDNQ